MSSTPQKPHSIPKDFNAMADKAVAETIQQTRETSDQNGELRDTIRTTSAESVEAVANPMLDYFALLQKMAKAQTEAAQNYWTRVSTVKSVPEMMEMTTEHARKQFDIYQTHATELVKAGQSMAKDSMKPLSGMMKKPF